MKPWAAVVAVTVLCAALYLPYLGAIELRGEEPRRILPARTMLATGDWIVPKIGGSIYRKKPPFLNWSIAASFIVTGGHTDWSARLPSVFWIGAFGITAALALRRRLGDWGALSVGLFFMSTLAMMDKGRMAEMEAMYAAQTGIAFVLWAAWWSAGKHWLAYTIPWFFLGLGMLTKGPAHLALFYTLMIPGLVFSKRLKDLWSGPHLIGLVLMTAVFLPWTLVNLRLTDEGGRTTGIWAGEMTDRLNLAEIDWSAWLVRPLQVLGDFLPWTPLLVLAWWRTGPIHPQPGQSTEAARWDALIRGTRWGILAGLLVLLLLPRGTARYCQPLFPAACLLLVDHWRRITEAERQPIEEQWSKVNAVAGWLAVAGAAIAAVVAPIYLESTWITGILGTLIALAVALIPRYLKQKAITLPPLVGSCLAMATVAGIALSHLGPIMDRDGDYRRTGREMTALLPDTSRPVIFYRTKYFCSLHYLDRPYQEIASSSRLPAGSAYIVLPAKDLSQRAFKEFLESYEVTELSRSTWETKEFVVLRIDPRGNAKPANSPS